jgi:peptidoglycan/LPS O-acetylase OafA/YrhL
MTAPAAQATRARPEPGLSNAPASGRGEETSRTNNFDTLRLVFAVCILIAHSYVHATGSGVIWIGVAGHVFRFDLWEVIGKTSLVGFFAIGGYLICGSYLASRDVVTYMWKRLLRIGPGFLPIAILCLLVVGPVGSDDARAYFHDLNVGEQLRGLATLRLSTRIAHVFPHNRDHMLDSPTWTLPVEFAMYVLVAILGVTGTLRRRWPVVLCWTALVALHVIIACFEPRWAKIPHFAQDSMKTTLPLYLVFVGGVLIRLYPLLRASTAVAAAALLWLIGYGCGIGYLCEYVAAPAIIIWVGKNRVRMPRLRDDLSYGIYLNSWPIQQLLLAFLSLGALTLAASTLAISAPLAMLSWRWIERPALRLKGIDMTRALRRALGQRQEQRSSQPSPQDESSVDAWIRE